MNKNRRRNTFIFSLFIEVYEVFNKMKERRTMEE